MTSAPKKVPENPRESVGGSQGVFVLHGSEILRSGRGSRLRSALRSLPRESGETVEDVHLPNSARSINVLLACRKAYTFAAW